MSRTFSANYPGTCAACFEDFGAGTEVQYTEPEGQLVHVECPFVVEEAPGAVCPECFLTLSVSGACGCDE